jgi:hypothetical protein
MQDRPTALELLAAVRAFITRQVVPAIDGGRQFHARVAANVLAIVERELRDGDELLSEEWAALRALCVPATDPPGTDDDVPPTDPRVLRAAVAALNADLAERIRNGEADRGPFRAAVLAHLRQAIGDKLRIANPGYLGEKTP